MKFVTGLVRLSYAHLTAPVENKLSGKTEYSVSLLIPKDDKKTVTRLKAAIKSILDDPEARQKWGGKTKGLRLPLHDGDEEREDDAVYAGHYYLNARADTDHRPKLVDQDREEIVDPEDIYSGCYAQAIISLYSYGKNGNNGIGAGILAIRKIKDGDKLGGVTISEDDWDDDDLGDEYDDILG